MGLRQPSGCTPPSSLLSQVGCEGGHVKQWLHLIPTLQPCKGKHTDRQEPTPLLKSIRSRGACKKALGSISWSMPTCSPSVSTCQLKACVKHWQYREQLLARAAWPKRKKTGICVPKKNTNRRGAFTNRSGACRSVSQTCIMTTQVP